MNKIKLNNGTELNIENGAKENGTDVKREV